MSKVRNVRGVGWDVSAIGNGSSLFLPFPCFQYILVLKEFAFQLSGVGRNWPMFLSLWGYQSWLLLPI